MSLLLLLIVVVDLLLIINKVTKGLLFRLLRVKLNKERFVLVRSINELGVKYLVGVVSDGYITISFSRKKKKRYPIKNRNIFYNSMGVFVVDYDEASESFFIRERPVSLMDAERYENLFLRALYKPEIVSNTEKLIKYLLFVIIVGLALALFLLYGINGQLSTLTSVGKSASVAAASVGGVA